MEKPTQPNFLRTIIEEDLAAGRHRTVVTRFPPEPNGYLHIGHSKSICLNFGLARDYGGRCHLRFDDTNPAKEDEEFVRAIEADIRWLGFDWGAHLYHASDYFGQLYEWAEHLVKTGHAYVCSQTEDEMRATRGTVTEPGTPSPDRDRPVEESLDLLRRMRAGEFEDGAYTLRAKIDMSSPNMKMRDPPMYRIRHQTHHRTGDTWCLYPMYDFAHGLSDAIEGITHSICTLEFDNNRELYDWYVEHCPVPAVPHQYEFAKLALTYTLMGKRHMRELVANQVVSGWDDPRMPTLAGVRRRGVRPEALRAFTEVIGVAKANSRVDLELLEHVIRDDLNEVAPRVMAVLRPLKLVIEGWGGEVEWLDAPHWPHDVPKQGSRQVPFTRELYIERDDFQEHPEPGFKRLAPGREVRLRYGYIVRCTGVVREGDTVIALRCTHDPQSRGGKAPDGRKVPGTIHWVSASHGISAKVRLYGRLYTVEEPTGAPEELDPNSLEEVDAVLEPSLAGSPPWTRVQFERQGYFMTDPVDSRPDAPVWNRIVTLKDSWTKAEDPSPRTKVEAQRGPTERKIDPAVAASPAFAAMVALGLAEEDASLLVQRPELATWFDEAVAAGGPARVVANLLIHTLAPAAGALDGLPFGPPALARLAQMVDSEAITHRGCRDALTVLLAEGGDPDALVDRLGLRRSTDEAALAAHVDAVLGAHPDEVARYKGGNPRLLGFFVGKVLAAAGKGADAKRVAELVRERLA